MVQTRLDPKVSALVQTWIYFWEFPAGLHPCSLLPQHSSGTVARYRVFVLSDLFLHSPSYINAQYNVGKGESALPSHMIQKTLEV